MGAILFLVAYGLIDIKEMKKIYKASKGEGIVLLVTFFSTLFLSMETAIMAGVVVSFLYYLKNTSKPNISVRVPNPEEDNLRRKFAEVEGDNECPQFKFVRVDGSIFFGALGHVEEQFTKYELAKPSQKHLVLLLKVSILSMLQGASF